MKKFKLFLVAFLFSLVIGFSSCNGCGNQAQEEQLKDSTEVVVKDSTVALNVEAAIVLIILL